MPPFMLQNRFSSLFHSVLFHWDDLTKPSFLSYTSRYTDTDQPVIALPLKGLTRSQEDPRMLRASDVEKTKDCRWMLYQLSPQGFHHLNLICMSLNTASNSKYHHSPVNTHKELNHPEEKIVGLY